MPPNEHNQIYTMQQYVVMFLQSEIVIVYVQYQALLYVRPFM